MPQLSIGDGLTEKLNVLAQQHGCAVDDIIKSLLVSDYDPHQADLRILRESEARYRALFEQTNDAVLIFDMDHTIVEANQRATTLLGCTMAEIIGRTSADFVIADEHDSVEEKRQRLLAGQITPVTERRLRRQDGKEITSETNAAMVYDEGGQPKSIQVTVRDITNRKLVERNLHENEVRYRSLFEQSNDAIFIFDLDLIFVEVNQQAADMLGYTVDEIIGRTGADFVFLDENYKVARQLEPLFSGQALPVYERRFRRKDGSEVIGEVNVTLIRDEQGQPHYFHSIVRDISERIHTEQTLHESEARYRSLFEQTNDAVFILNPAIEIVEVNQRAADLLGYTPAEIIGLSGADIVVPDEHNKMHERQAQLLAGQIPPIYERRFRCKDGSEVIGEISITLVQNEAGQPRHIQSIVRDITERKRAEETIRQSQQLLEKVFASLHVAIFVYDERTMEAIDCNPAATRIFGYSRVEILGQSPAYFHASGPSFREFVGLLADAVAQQGFLYLPEFQMKRKDGSVFPSEHHVTPLHDEHDEIIAWVSVVRDISTRKQADKQALELVIERERAQVLSNFIRDASHEFRTPLTIINTKTFLLDRMAESEQQQVHLAGIRDQVAKIVRLVDGLATMNRLENEQEKRSQPIRLNDFLRAACFAQEAQVAKRNLQLMMDLASHLPDLRGNSDDMNQALSEIVMNAIRFTPDGGQVVVRSRAEGANVVVEVSDTGSGIASEHLPRIYERFYRADTAHTTSGFGLGLAIAHKIVSDHGGEIQVETTPGAGSSFRVTLPLPEPVA